ncbi:MAG: peptidoglycan recognition family protein [Cyanobacteria bacterium P01_D01_bin.105]
MHRSWIIWLVSTFAFCTTIAAILAVGPSQNLSSSNVKAQEDGAADKKANAVDTTVQLPEVSASTASSSSISTESSASQVASQPENGNPLALSATAPAAQTQAQAQAQTQSQLQPQLAQAKAVVGLSYQPKEIVQLAHPSNYGKRYTHDVNGSAVDNEYIVVLHETVGSASSALNTFQTNHPRDEDQVSYHTLIGLDGTIYYVVPPEQRAFGAGDSVFQSFQGEEAVFTNAEFPSSVNNFAYHISLETPLDGQNNNATYHSGYTETQYQSLAWLLSRTNIPDDRITTHRTVDRSGSRMDPRSFEADRMFRLLRQYPSRQQAG